MWSNKYLANGLRITLATKTTAIWFCQGFLQVMGIDRHYITRKEIVKTHRRNAVEC